MPRSTILFADNDPDFLDTRAESLERAGYRVLKAYSLEQTRQMFADTYFHLAVLDIRMVDDDDERDVTGLTLAKDRRYRSVPKIILTGFSTYQAVREALGPAVEGLPPAVDFLDKREGPEALLASVERALSRHVGTNWNLEIRWKLRGELRSPHFVNLLQPGLPEERLPNWAGELEDLFRKLFCEYDHLNLGRILTWRDGWGLLTAFAFRDQGAEEACIVAYGHRDEVREEETRYSSFVLDKTGVSLVDSVETLHFGATAYRLLGCALEDVLRLDEYYHRGSVEDLQAGVRDLFHKTLKPYYSRGQEEKDQPLQAFFQERLSRRDNALTQSELEERVEGICRATLKAGLLRLGYSPHRLTLASPDGARWSYPNPAPYLSEERVAVGPPTRCGTIHGRLDAERVLLDGERRTWVVDFGESGMGPLVLDFATLESSVKFDLLEGKCLSARAELEERLLAMSNLDDGVDVRGLDPDTAKALDVIGAVRSGAAAVLGPDVEAYQVALLYCAAEEFMAYEPAVRYTRGEVAVFAHSLLSMAAICRQLFSWEDRLQNLPEQAAESLWMDAENRVVWVEGRRVELAGQGFSLLEYLYDHANQLCERTELATAVFDVDLSGYLPAERKDLVKDTINTAISRLRKDIEPNPSHPKYIRTVRGAGYRLDLRGASTSKSS